MADPEDKNIDEGAEDKPKSKGKKDPKITQNDFKKAETVLKSELAKRKSASFRRLAEMKWKVVDRQVSLTPADTEESHADEEWLNTFELGTLANSSEIMTADLLRVVFPDQRAWFEAHIEITGQLDTQTGDRKPIDKKIQNSADGRLRAMMTQQHTMFGLRDRVELSIKEALHHGGFVAEVTDEFMDMYFNGTTVREISAPVWKPHSMWNCWPDPSPSLVGTNMFYNGSMFVEYYQPRHKFMESAVGEGWIKSALKKVPKEEHNVKDNPTKDVKVTVYWGDVIIPKSGDGVSTNADDLFFPNYKAILANGKLVYLEENKTPYPPIIYKTYEKMDVRDPYGTSPLIKQSPIQSISSILSNEYVNSVQLNTRPPLVYDGNDPDFVMNGGPMISPGAKTSSKGSNSYQEMKIGDPNAALAGVQFCVTTMKEALGRPGIQTGDRATATEVNTKQADSEAGPFGFAVKLDSALTTFLYMQHAMNLADKDFKFSYYNPEIDSPDFLRVEHKDLPDTVHFEVVGSKGVLGESRRHQAFSVVTMALAGHPMFAPLLKPLEIAKQMYTDAGIKGAERFLQDSQDNIPPQVKQQMQQMQQMIQQLQGKLKDEMSQTQVKTNKMQLDHQAKMGKLQLQQQADTQDHQTKVAELQIKLMKDKAEYDMDLKRLQAARDTAAVGHLVDLHKHTKDDLHKKLQLAVDLSAPENMPTEPTEELPAV